MAIDILLPFHGDPAYLKIAVRSVLYQSESTWRLVVVDDAYPDESVSEWFDTLDDERIHYQRNSVNRGLPAIYQQCLRLVRNELVVFMGADDIMLPNYVSTITRLHKEHPEASMIQPGVALVDESGAALNTLTDVVKKQVFAPRIGKEPLAMSGERLATSLLRGNWLYFPSLVFDADMFGDVGFRDDLNAVHDLAFVIDLLLRDESMLIDDTACFLYRRHGANDSSTRALDGSRFTDERDYFLTIADELDVHGWHGAARAARTHISSRLHALTLVPGALRAGRKGGARNLLRHAFGPERRHVRHFDHG